MATSQSIPLKVLGSVLLLTFLSTVASCATLQDRFCPPRPPAPEALPKLEKLNQPVLHKYKFKKTEVEDVFSITREEVGLISSDLASLVDVVNRYEQLIDEYNAIADRTNPASGGEHSIPSNPKVTPTP